MERVRRLARFWNWLPAFRVTAETAHLPTASEALHISPSALSRTIRLLEEDVGQPLFDRVGRNIALNAAGQRLLAAVRDAMRTGRVPPVRHGYQLGLEKMAQAWKQPRRPGAGADHRPFERHALGLR